MHIYKNMYICVYCTVRVCIHKYTAMCVHYTTNNEEMSTEQKQVSISLELVMGLNQNPRSKCHCFWKA